MNWFDWNTFIGWFLLASNICLMGYVIFTRFDVLKCKAMLYDLHYSHYNKSHHVEDQLELVTNCLKNISKKLDIIESHCQLQRSEAEFRREMDKFKDGFFAAPKPPLVTRKKPGPKPKGKDAAT